MKKQMTLSLAAFEQIENVHLNATATLDVIYIEAWIGDKKVYLKLTPTEVSQSEYNNAEGVDLNLFKEGN